MKSATIWPFIDFKGSQAKSYSIKVYAHLPILPLKIGFCNICFITSVWHTTKRAKFGRQQNSLCGMEYLSYIFAPGIWTATARSSQIVLASLLTCDLLWQVGGTSLESFMIIGRVSSEAVLDAKRMSKRSFLNRLMIWLEEVMLEARFFSLKLMLCFMQLRKLLPS